MAGVGHALPHDPQLDTSVAVVEQMRLAAQKVVPAGHELTHIPMAQCVPTPHAVPQPPQLALVFNWASQPLEAVPSQLP